MNDNVKIKTIYLKQNGEVVLLLEHLFRKNEISFSTAMSLVYDTNIHTLRNRIRILIVDDEKFDIVDMLKERKYDIYYKKDITYAIEAEAFDIVIIDIVGIGGALGSNMGGFAIASDIKKRYPAKQVWCYSGSTVKSEIAEKIRQIDGYILKDTGIDQWCEKLDAMIEKYCSKEYQKGVLKEQLKQCGLDDSDINKVISEYENGIEKKNFNSVVELLTQFVTSGKRLLEFIEMIYSFASHFAV